MTRSGPTCPGRIRVPSLRIRLNRTSAEYPLPWCGSEGTPLLPGDEIMVRRAEQYTAARGQHLAERLGAGNDGSVWMTSRRAALKVHRQFARYRREVQAYERLAGVNTVAGHALPHMIDHDDMLLAIEMTTVEPPFVLDFASAYPVAEAPEFPPEVLERWLAEKQEQFGALWPRAAAVIRALERDHGLRLTDVHPGNIRFAPEDRE